MGRAGSSIVSARPKPGAKITPELFAEYEECLQAEILEDVGFKFKNPHITGFFTEVSERTGLITAYHAIIEHDGPRD